MIVAGVTGGIGSGKTTVCREFEKLGAKVIYADELAKNLMSNDQRVISDLKNKFGDQTFLPDGTLNKPHLIREAFEKGRVEELNAIVHPAVYRRFDQIRKEEKKAGTRVLIKEAAILLNNGRPPNIDLVILVLSDPKQQIRRVQERDGSDKEDVLQRMNKQPDFEKLQNLADYIIRNDGTLEELKDKARSLYNTICDKS